MGEDDVSENIQEMRQEVVSDIFSRSIPPESIDEQWDVDTLENELQDSFGFEIPVQQWLDNDKSLHEDTLLEKVQQTILDAYAQKEQRHGPELMRHLEKVVMLQILDTQWKEHLAEMDYLRKGIGLRSYAQKNPKQAQQCLIELNLKSLALFQKLKYKVRLK